MEAEAPIRVCRRGVELGWVGPAEEQEDDNHACLSQHWAAARPIYLAGFITPAELAGHGHHIAQALALMEAVLAEEDLEALLHAPPYQARLQPRFHLLPAGIDAGDEQEIMRLDFDVYEGGRLVADDLWVKLSWLSFHLDDASLRFRFSFGIEGYENVAADWRKQGLAADLTEAIFPESALISENSFLRGLLEAILPIEQGIDYVERIIYFNAPNGGAQFHQDVERGHLGVVFAQLHGRSIWLALPKQELVRQVMAFLQEDRQAAQQLAIKPSSWRRLQKVASDAARLSASFDAGDNEALEAVLNRSPEFFARLVRQGHACLLEPGDIILLPQRDHEHCAWHSVFCGDDFPGHALSFAIRGRPESEASS